MVKIVWELPIHTVSEANKKEHWTKAARRHQQQQFLVRHAFLRAGCSILFPCTVKLIRIGGRFLDKDDNLRMAFKWIKDELADCLFPDARRTYVDKKGIVRSLKGRSDDNPTVTWEYDQEKGKRCSIRVEIEDSADARKDKLEAKRDFATGFERKSQEPTPDRQKGDG